MHLSTTKVIHTVKDFILAQPYPVLVHQMSKVGSTTVCNSLRAAGVRPWHVHFVSIGQWRAIRDAYYQSGHYDLPHHVYMEYLVRKYLKATNHRVKVVSLVRDPVARQLSGVFQTPEFTDVNITESSIGDLTSQIAEHVSKMSKKRSYARKWFDKEIKGIYGVDIFRHSFDKEQGYGLYEADRADIIILQLEKLSNLISNILGTFIGKKLSMIKGNMRSKKDKSDIYNEIKKEISIDGNTLKDIYSSQWVRYFYTDRQIANFMNTWSAR